LDETYEGAYVITNSVLVDLLGETFNDRGMLGIDFLKYYDFLFDYRDLRNGKSTGLYYEPNTPLEERNYGFWGLLKEPPEFGVIDYTIKDDNIVILSVVKGSIAHTQFGALPGMIVTKINGKSYKEFFTGETLDPSFYLTIDNYTILKDGVEQTIVSPLKHEVSASN
jgi:hypothetical protein